MLARLNHIIAASGNPHRESEAKGVGIIKDLIYFPTFDAKGEIPKVKDFWIATQEQLEEYYFVRGIEYMWDITKDPEFIAERAAGKTIHLKFKIP